jgi:uroporphyrinogen decarboxylase
MDYSHRQRLEQTLSGEQPDRTPLALWHHFPVDDQDPESLAYATIAFQKQFDFDLVKVMPPSSFCLKDCGVEDEWRGNPEGTRAYTRRAIYSPEDWLNLPVLDPQKGYLKKQLTCLEILQEELSEQTPFIQTIFNPLSQAKNLVGPENLPMHLRCFPSAMHEGLKKIQETTLSFIHAAKSFGISGIFFAIQHATYDILTRSEYEEFGRAYDLPLLDAVDDLWLNMVHLHGQNIMFDLITDYPIQILNWHDQETPPSLSEGLAQFSGCACGGIAQVDTLVLGTPEDVKVEVKQAIEETGGKRLILGTGCVMPLTTPYGNIMAARSAVEELA